MATVAAAALEAPLWRQQGGGRSSFKVDTRPCLREGEFPSHGAASSSLLPLLSPSEIGLGVVRHRPTCHLLGRSSTGQARPAPPCPAIRAPCVQDGLKKRGVPLLLPSEKDGGPPGKGTARIHKAGV